MSTQPDPRPEDGSLWWARCPALRLHGVHAFCCAPSTGLSTAQIMLLQQFSESLQLNDISPPITKAQPAMKGNTVPVGDICYGICLDSTSLGLGKALPLISSCASKRKELPASCRASGITPTARSGVGTGHGTRVMQPTPTPTSPARAHSPLMLGLPDMTPGVSIFAAM